MQPDWPRGIAAARCWAELSSAPSLQVPWQHAHECSPQRRAVRRVPGAPNLNLLSQWATSGGGGGLQPCSLSAFFCRIRFPPPNTSSHHRRCRRRLPTATHCNAHQPGRLGSKWSNAPSAAVNDHLNSKTCWLLLSMSWSRALRHCTPKRRRLLHHSALAMAIAPSLHSFTLSSHVALLQPPTAAYTGAAGAVPQVRPLSRCGCTANLL